jgi:hypothetical protein
MWAQINGRAEIILFSVWLLTMVTKMNAMFKVVTPLNSKESDFSEEHIVSIFRVEK